MEWSPPALPSNEQATLALLQGEVDWAGNFLLTIDRIFVSEIQSIIPIGFQRWERASCCIRITRAHPLTISTFEKPFLSVLIAHFVKVALHDYVPPADESGLSSAYDAWRMEDWDSRDKWTDYDPERAGQL